MKPAHISELRRRLRGAVSDAKPVRAHFSHDAGVLSVTPAAVAYPRSAADVQAAVAYGAGLAAAAKGGGFTITARGVGSGRSGGALGEGLVLALGAHLNRVTQVGKDTLTVQAGLPTTALQTALQTHRRFFPAGPVAAHRGTIGGLLAANGLGSRSLKYGAASAWVKSLKVVLDDGSQIETRRLNRWELSRKKGLMTREGEIYRKIDGLIQDHQGLMKDSLRPTAFNAAGYRLRAVKGWDGSFDLGQLFLGAQGTLGIITEATIATLPLPSRRVVLAGYFETMEALGQALPQLAALDPSVLEMVGATGLAWVRAAHPELITGVIGEGELPAAALLVEFDNLSYFRQNRLRRRATRILQRYAKSHHSTTNPQHQQELWSLVRSLPAAKFLADTGATGTASKPQPLPIIDDAAVPPQRLPEFLEALTKLLTKRKLEAAVWGSAGAGHLHVLPLLDITKAKGRQQALKLMDEFYALVTDFGGITTASQGDGRLRAPYLEKLYGKEMSQLFTEVKQICDPHGLFAPHTKAVVTKKQLSSWLRPDYSWESAYDRLPPL